MKTADELNRDVAWYLIFQINHLRKIRHGYRRDGYPKQYVNDVSRSIRTLVHTAGCLRAFGLSFKLSSNLRQTSAKLTPDEIIGYDENGGMKGWELEGSVINIPNLPF